MVKCLVSQQQQGCQLNSLELNPVTLWTTVLCKEQARTTHTQVILNLNLLCHMAWTGLSLLPTSASKECVLTTSGAGARAGDLNYPPPGAS